MYVYAFDVSLQSTGVAIFEDNEQLVHYFNITTSSRVEHKDRLKKIADVLLECRKKYNPSVTVFERGFSLHPASTQGIFKVVGLIQYLFWDCEQIFYPPTTVKKMVSDDGKASKEQVKKEVVKRYGVKIENTDQSDAIAVGICHFKSGK